MTINDPGPDRFDWILLGGVMLFLIVALTVAGASCFGG